MVVKRCRYGFYSLRIVAPREDVLLFGSKFFRMIKFMTEKHLIFMLILGLTVALSSGCRRQSSVTNDTESDTATPSGDSTDTSSDTSSTTSDTTDTSVGSTDSSTVTEGARDTGSEETDSDTGDPGDTATDTGSQDTATTTADTETATADTVSSDDTATDTWSDVTTVDTEHWQTVFEFSDAMEIVRVTQADDDGVMAISSEQLIWIPDVNSAVFHSITEADETAHIHDAYRTEAGIWVTGDKNKLYFLSNDGVWVVIRDANGTGRAQANQLAGYENTLYAVTSWDQENAAGSMGNGFLIRFDGQNWSPVETGECDGWFQTLHILKNGSLVAVSAKGLALFNGSVWRYDVGTALNNADDVNDIWGLNENDFWVASTSLWHVVNGDWQEVLPTVDDPLVMSEFSAVAYVNGVTGNANDDLYVSVVYTAGVTGSSGSSSSSEEEGVDWDLAYWEESYVAHFDGLAFSVLQGSINVGMSLQDMALWETELYLSGERFQLIGDSFETVTDYPIGRMSRDVNGDLYACKVLSGCEGGVRYDGAAWECLDIGSTRLVDIVPATDGTVYGLTVGSAILSLRDGEVTEIHEPKCTISDYRFEEGVPLPVGDCTEGHRIAWDGTAWQMVDGVSRTGLDRFCYAGDTLFGYRNVYKGSQLVRATTSELNEVESDRVFDDITCGSSGAVLYDNPSYFTDGQRFYSFDGESLTLVATWALESSNGAIYEYVVSDTLQITALLMKDQVYFIAFWDGATWQVQAIPPDINPLNFTPDGRLFAFSTATNTLMEYIP